jgi:transcriptional regulator with XRE-family HTH domain
MQEPILREPCELDMVLIGKRIKAARREKKMTQEELAEYCNCTSTHICNIENAKIGISLERLFKISVILEKSMDYFVMDNPYANPHTKIDAEIAPKLVQCDPQMLEIVNALLDRLLTYRASINETINRMLVEATEN